MKINRIRNPATMVPGAQWIDGLDTIGQLSSAGAPEPTPEPVKLPPLPPIDHEHEARWKAAVDRADEVVELLRQSGELDTDLLFRVMTDLVEGNYTIGDVGAVYRHRKGM